MKSADDCAFNNIFFWKWPPKFQSPTKVRDAVSPKWDKIWKIRFHQKMYLKKLPPDIQTSAPKSNLQCANTILSHFDKDLFYKRDYIHKVKQIFLNLVFDCFHFDELQPSGATSVILSSCIKMTVLICKTMLFF